ncbi:Glucose / Sorbosone dehydrogenase [seawater metagenome]|uniref:Glucose / Sorbosone dehydrogenase n=1 Tax=seawater metagenome TaxID=1561972 RepID=A0A5E8CHY5_9ZZZZ
MNILKLILLILFISLVIFTLMYEKISSQSQKKKTKILDNFDKPWSFSFIDDDNIILSERTGKIIYCNLEEKTKNSIKHNLKYFVNKQGGLLDILFYNDFVYISYAEDRGNNLSNTSVAKAKFNTEKLEFTNIFEAKDQYDTEFHYGSRIIIVDNYLYLTVGDRHNPDKAIDEEHHIGKIIKINLKDDTYSIFVKGVRNPQGLTYDSQTNNIFISNHGAKGGDFITKIEEGHNYGWNEVAWGGKNYVNTSIGPTWKKGFTKPSKYWVPSIATSSIVYYDSDKYPNYKNKIILGTLKEQDIRVIDISEDDTEIITVKVNNNNKYFFENLDKEIGFKIGKKYIFDIFDDSNKGRPLEIYFNGKKLDLEQEKGDNHSHFIFNPTTKGTINFKCEYHQGMGDNYIDIPVQGKFNNEEIIIKVNERVRDIKINSEGDIYFITDAGNLYKLK